MELKRLSGILMRTAAVLLVLVMMSTALVTGRFARYTSSASGSDSARVAKFEVTEDSVEGEKSLLESFTVSLRPGESTKRSVKVTNNSEVTIDYMIEVKELYDFLPLEYTVEYKDKNGNTDTAPVPFTGTLKDNTYNTFTLVISWPATETDFKYAGQVDCLNITLTTAQKD